MTQELARIKDVGFGMKDANSPLLWFTAQSLSGESLQGFFERDALKFIKDNDISNIKYLEGAVCIIETDNGIQRVIGLFK
jgi:hypothetical protein